MKLVNSKPNKYLVWFLRQHLVFTTTATTIFPTVAQAETGSSCDAVTINCILNKFITLFNLVIIILFIVATIVFLWGLIISLTGAGDPEKIKQGKNLVLWGIIALAVMSATWGMVLILRTTFDIEPGRIPLNFSPQTSR